MSRTFQYLRLPTILATALLLLTGRTLAQADSSVPALSLRSALHRAIERNPALLAQGHQERAAEALIEQAGLRPNPTLDVALENFAGTGAVRGGRGLEATVQASQTLERGGKRDQRVALAGREREATAQAYAVRRAEILAMAAAAYIETLAAQRRLALAAEPLRLARETVKAAEGRVQAGAASPAESARARAGLATAQAELARAEAALQASRAKLAATWGGASGEVPTLSGTLRSPDALPDREALQARLAGHPRVNLHQSIIASRRATLDLEQTQAVQDITVGGGVRFLRDGSDAAFVAGVSMPLPVRNRNQGNIRAARALLAGAEQGGRAVEVELHAEFNAAWQDLTTAHRTALSLREQALPAMEAAQAAVHHAYAQGQLPLIDVLDAQRALVTIRREILDAETDCALALARLDALTDPAFNSVSALIAQP